MEFKKDNSCKLGVWIWTDVEDGSRIIVVDDYPGNILYQGEAQLLPIRLSGYEVCKIAPYLHTEKNGKKTAYIRVLVRNHE